MKKESGFTLIEIIVTLLLVGIMAAIAGMGISSAARGYLFARNNVAVAGKAQAALARMTRELVSLANITQSSSSSIQFNKVDESIAFGQSGTTIRFAKAAFPGTAPDFTTGDILTDNVAAFSISYRKGSGAWSSSENINLLSHIVLTLTMSGAGEGSNVQFTTTVTPRNNGNVGGVSPPRYSSTSSAPARYGCFVATAAYGNQFHPMVILLKQFRDQYLVKWPGGSFLIRLYYQKGPCLAAMIQDKPWACAVARLLLFPLAVIAFILVYAKGTIPLLISVMILGILFLKRYPGRSKIMEKSTIIQKEKGSVLIGLIVTMVIMALLGAALVSMTSSSAVSNVYDVMHQKAYYLAESGFRYAASEYLNVTDNNNNGKNDEQNSKVNNDVNGRTVTLSDGSFSLNLTPFNYVTSETRSAGATSLPVRFAGGTPAGFAIPTSGKIHITTQTRPNSSSPYTTYSQTYSYNGFSSSTFNNLSPALLFAVPAWTSVTVIASPSSSQNVRPDPDVTRTDNRLTLSNPNAGSGQFFMPKRNGKFTIEGNATMFKYAYREDASSTTTLYGVCNADDPDNHATFSVTTAFNIMPKDFYTVVSTGTVGTGDNAVNRRLTFITPIDVTSPKGSGAKQSFTDSVTAGINPGGTGSNWYSPVHGSYDVASVSEGGKSDGTSGMDALRLTSSYLWGSVGKYFSILPLNWNQNYANFWATWFGNDKTLSYDAQVKIKYNNQDYYMSGLLFRLNLDRVNAHSISQASWLGISYMRGNTEWLETDGMYASSLPIDNTPLIVLWKKDSGDSLNKMTWIAYKRLDSHDFNQGQSFTNGNYFIMGKTSGARATVTVTGSDGTTGSFIPYSGYFGNKGIYGRFQPGEDLVKIERVVSYPLGLPAYVFLSAKTVSSGSITEFYVGSDVGNSTGPVVGDIISGTLSGATARITGISKTGGSWWWSSATGSITVDQKKGNFWENEICTIYRPATTKVANYLFSLSDVLEQNSWEQINPWSMIVLRLEEKLAGSAPFSGSYVNDIKIYLSDTEGRESATGTPLDMFRHASKRWSNPIAAGDVEWPADAGWSSNLAGNADRDHFTLVRGWVFNTAQSDVNNNYKLTGTTEEPNSTIRTTEFTTHGMGTFNQNELGLWTSGKQSAYNVFFDDFALRLEEVRAEAAFTTPLMLE